MSQKYNSTIESQLEILRRIAETGQRQAHFDYRKYSRFVDIFQHMLDEIERTKIYVKKNYEYK